MRSLILILLLFGLVFAKYPKDFSKPLSRIAFGSCNKQDEEQPAWKHLESLNPDLFVWLGDVVYADHSIIPAFSRPSDLNVVRERYVKQKNLANYTRFRENFDIIGAWDDHDYNCNNCGKHYSGKNMTQQLFLDFVDEPNYTSRRDQEGLYTSYIFGPKGSQVKIILLDTRYFADSANESNKDILGQKQWKWLEKTLQKKTEVTIITSGIQISPTHKPIQEKWANFGLNSRKKLFQLLNSTKTSGAFLLSGDVHYGEFFVNNCTGLGYPLFELTSSGMTHCCGEMPFGICDLVLNSFMQDPYRFKQDSYYPWYNFGLVEIDWDFDEKNPEISFQLRNAVDGQIEFEHKVFLSDLKPGNKQFKQDLNSSFCLSQEGPLPFYLVMSMEAVRNAVLSAVFSFVFTLGFYLFHRKF